VKGKITENYVETMAINLARKVRIKYTFCCVTCIHLLICKTCD